MAALCTEVLLVKLWEGPIALLDTTTNDRRVIAKPKLGQMWHAPLPLPVMLWTEHSGTLHGWMVHVEIRGRVLWAEGVADVYLTEMLHIHGTLPCGVDLDDLLLVEVRPLFRRWGKMVSKNWRLRAVTLYLGTGKSAFGGKTFIRLKEPQ